MRIFVNAWFQRFARKRGISDIALCEAIDRAERGLIDAEPGGGVIKQRVARTGHGKSGGFRTIILYLQANRAFFVYGFAKSELANISATDEVQFKKAARYVFGLSEAQMDELIDASAFVEVIQGDKEIPQ